MKRARVIDILRREEPVFEGVPERVRTLAAICPLALASGSERQVVEAVLSLKELGLYLTAIVSGSDVKRGKPAPDIFLRAAELLKVPPADCWVVEDSKHGIAAAKAAGMRVIAITNTYPAAELQNAEHVATNYAEIGALFSQLLCET